jgi:hypothetical protein
MLSFWVVLCLTAALGFRHAAFTAACTAPLPRTVIGFTTDAQTLPSAAAIGALDIIALWLIVR